MKEKRVRPQKDAAKKEWRPKLSQASFWVFVVALMAIIPLFLNVSLNLLRGDEPGVVLSKYFPDFLIVIFSLAISIFYDIVHPCHHKWTLVFSVSSMIVCVGFYYILGSIETIQSHHLKIVVIGGIVLYVVNLFLGGSLKWRTAQQSEGKDEGVT